MGTGFNEREESDGQDLPEEPREIEHGRRAAKRAATRVLALLGTELIKDGVRRGVEALAKHL